MMSPYRRSVCYCLQPSLWQGTQHQAFSILTLNPSCRTSTCHFVDSTPVTVYSTFCGKTAGNLHSESEPITCKDLTCHHSVVGLQDNQVGYGRIGTFWHRMHNSCAVTKAALVFRIIFPRLQGSSVEIGVHCHGGHVLGSRALCNHGLSRRALGNHALRSHAALPVLSPWSTLSQTSRKCNAGMLPLSALACAVKVDDRRIARK